MLTVTGIAISKAQQEHGKRALCCCLHPVRRRDWRGLFRRPYSYGCRRASAVEAHTVHCCGPSNRRDRCVGWNPGLQDRQRSPRPGPAIARQHLGPRAGVPADHLGRKRSPRMGPRVTVSPRRLYSRRTASEADRPCRRSCNDRPRALRSLLQQGWQLAGGGCARRGAASFVHTQCRLAGPQVEALHIQRQADRPGSAALLGVLEPKAADTKHASVTAIAGGACPRTCGVSARSRHAPSPSSAQSTRPCRWSLSATQRAS